MGAGALQLSIFGRKTDEVRDLAAVVTVPGGAEDGSQADEIQTAANVGGLFWYTLPGLKLEPAVLAEAFSKAGIDPRYLPGKIKASDAFRRATSGLKREDVDPQDGGGSKVSLLVRDAGGDKERIVRQIVVEVKESSKRKLRYAPAAQLELEKSTGVASVASLPGMDDLPIEVRFLVREATDAFSGAFENAMKYLDDGHVRRSVDALMTAEHVITVRPSGGVYFALEARKRVVRQLDTLFEALRAVADGSRFYDVSVVDIAKQRAMVAEATLAHVKAEVHGLVREMDDILLEQRDGRRVRQATADRYLSEAKRLSDLVREYRDATRDRLTEASSDLDILREQVTALLTVAE